MRPIQPDSSPLRIWFVMFPILSAIVGFVLLVVSVGFGILSPSLGIPAPGRWIVVSALIMGAYIAWRSTRTEMLVRQQRKEAAVNLPGEHPRLGAYRSWPYSSRWSATVSLTPGAEPSINLSGSGLAPGEDDVALWLDRIAPRMDELMTTVGMKLGAGGPVEGSGSKIKLSPRRVEFGKPGAITFLMNAEPEPDSRVAPVAEFSRDLELRAVHWTP